MTTTKWVLLAVAGLALICFFIWKSGWRPKGVFVPGTKSLQDFWKDWWIDGKLLPILVCFTLIHLSLFKLAPKFWVSQAWGDWSSAGWFWGIQIALGVAASIQKEDKAKPAKYTLGKLAIILLVITFIIHIGGWNVEAKIDQAVKIIHGEDEGSSNAHAATRPGNFLDVKIEKMPCLEHDGLEGLDSDKIRKDLREYPALLAIACRESGLNHMDPNNPSKVFSGKQDPRDKGFLQINTHYHKPETVQKVAGCKNLEDYGCSLSYGIKLYEADGLNAWFPYGTSNERGRDYKPLTVFVIAKDRFGPRINIPRLTNTYRFDHQGKTVVVEAEDQNGIKKKYTLVDDDKTAPVNIGTDIRWVRFKRGPDEKENVKVNITYTFQVP